MILFNTDSDDLGKLPVGKHNDIRITNVNYNEKFQSLYIHFSNDEGTYTYKQKWDFDLMNKKKFNFRIETLVHIFDKAFNNTETLSILKRESTLSNIAKYMNDNLSKSVLFRIELKANTFNGVDYISFDVINKPFVFDNEKTKAKAKAKATVVETPIEEPLPF